MRLTRVALPAGEGEGIVAAFPSAEPRPGPRVSILGSSPELPAESEPLAFLSLATSGDMKFGSPSSAANRERFLGLAGFESSRVLGLELSHSRRVSYLPRGSWPAAQPNDPGGADGLILTEPRLAATVTVADCMPIFILDRDSGAFGLLHSGWRGTGILAEALRSIVERSGSRASSMAVILGPAIGPCCYEVPPERAELFRAEFGEAAVQSRAGASFLDLREANLGLARKLGIGQVLSIEACSSCDRRLGSYRRQGAAAFTRMLALVGRPETPRGGGRAAKRSQAPGSPP